MCGGVAGIACAKGLFCEPAPATCQVADVAGVCRVQPQICTQIYKPVCGCDGKTYGNDCMRRAAQVPLDHPCAPAGGGEGAMCGGFAGFPCASGLFCDPPPDMCRVADVAGVCRTQPQICPDIFAPVCGCDGKTYGNDCNRQSVGAPKAHDGACT